MSGALTIRDVCLSFGGIDVLQNVSFDVASGTVLGLVGPNGAGKTSLFNCISGLYRPKSGSISLDGIELLRMSPSRHAKAGLARTFQHPALQLESSVMENVMVGAHSRLRGNVVTSGFRLPWVRQTETELRKEAYELLERLELVEYADTPASEVASGLYPRIEIGRALLSKPRLVLLDEPSAGLPHAEVEELIGWLSRVREEFDLTVVIVGHHMGMITALADRVVVLDEGKKLMEGTAREAQLDPRVIEAYLGIGIANEYS